MAKFIILLCILCLSGIMYSQTDILLNETYESSVSAGELVYFTGTYWDEADATSEAAPCTTGVGIALGNNQVLIRGIYKTSGLSSGNYYISTTAGQWTATAPSASTNVVRLIGYSLGALELNFQPDNTWVVVP